MIMNISDIKRVDFTPECKNCKYRKDLGLLSYCCEFVIELYQKAHFENLNKDPLFHILPEMHDYFTVVNPSNVDFHRDEEFSVTLTFKTNLYLEKKIILGKLREQILKSPYFANVNFGKDFKVNTIERPEDNPLPLFDLSEKIRKNKEECDVE